MSQVNNFDFNEYNEIDYINKPLRHAFNLNQFADKIDLVEKTGRLKDDSANYVRYEEFNKEMYLSPEKLINPTYNSLFENLSNSGIKFINNIDPLFESYINKYIDNLIEWSNDIFLPDLKKISGLLNSNDIFLKYCPGMILETIESIIPHCVENCEANSLESYYFKFASRNNYIHPAIYPYEFINHLNYLFKTSNNLFNVNLEFYVYKPKDPSLTKDYENYVLNIKLL